METGTSIIGTNMYCYCDNNPVGSKDSTGYIPVETVLDVAGLAWSAADMVADPSLLNAAFLLWDVAAIVIPYAPGSYVGKGIKISAKAFSKADDVIDFARLLNKADDVFDVAKALDKANDTSKVFRKFTKGNFRHNLSAFTGLAGDAIKGLEAHHIFPKALADDFARIGISNVNNPAFGVWVSNKGFFRNYPFQSPKLNADRKGKA